MLYMLIIIKEVLPAGTLSHTKKYKILVKAKKKSIYLIHKA
jgi:hypothetical protein